MSFSLIFSDISFGFLDFFINHQLRILRHDGSTRSPNNYANYRAEFFDTLDKVKMAVPSGVQQTKSILSIPRASQSIHFGNWDLSSVEDGTMQVINRENPWKELTIKEDFVRVGSRIPLIHWIFCLFFCTLFLIFFRVRKSGIFYCFFLSIACALICFKV